MKYVILFAITMTVATANAELPLLWISDRESRQVAWSRAEIQNLGGLILSEERTQQYPPNGGYTTEANPQQVTATSHKILPAAQFSWAQGRTHALALQLLDTYEVQAMGIAENHVNTKGYPSGVRGKACSGGYSVMRRQLRVVDPEYTNPTQLWFGTIEIDLSQSQEIATGDGPHVMTSEVKGVLDDQWVNVEYDDDAEAWHATGMIRNLFGVWLQIDEWHEERTWQKKWYPTLHQIPKGQKVLIEARCKFDPLVDDPQQLETHAANPPIAPLAVTQERDEEVSHWVNVRVTEIFDQ